MTAKVTSALSRLELVVGKRGRKRTDKKKAKKKDPGALPGFEAEPEDTEPEVPDKPVEQPVEQPATGDALSKIKKMADQQLLLINPNVSDTNVEDEDEGQAEKGMASYKEFLSERKGILARSVNLTNADGVSVWIVDGSQKKDLDARLRYHQIAFQFIGMPPSFWENDAPFDDVKVRLKGVDREQMREDLSQLWKTIDPKEETDNGQDEEDTESEKGEEDKKGDDGDAEEGLLEEVPDPLDEADMASLQKIRSLQKPYLFVLSPKDPERYVQFVTDSKVLPKLHPFLESNIKFNVHDKQVGTTVYFVEYSQITELVNELKKYNPLYQLGSIADEKGTADEFVAKENPFDGLELNGKGLGPSNLVNELNVHWRKLASGSSGNLMPAVQINVLVPLNYTRFMSREHKNVDLYMGDRPSGAGARGTAYVLTETNAKADAFIKTVRKFKLPSLFYKMLYSIPDIDMGFKSTKPRPYTPANVLVLTGDFSKMEDSERLKELHEFAKNELGNPAMPGLYIKGQYSLGTNVVQFNADMSICFVWGSSTKSVSVNKKKVMEQFPFVEKVTTDWL